VLGRRANADGQKLIKSCTNDLCEKEVARAQRLAFIQHSSRPLFGGAASMPIGSAAVSQKVAAPR
jgi:hypothetical protein